MQPPQQHDEAEEEDDEVFEVKVANRGRKQSHAELTGRLPVAITLPVAPPPTLEFDVREGMRSEAGAASTGEGAAAREDGPHIVADLEVDGYTAHYTAPLQLPLKKKNAEGSGGGGGGGGGAGGGSRYAIAVVDRKRKRMVLAPLQGSRPVRARVAADGDGADAGAAAGGADGAEAAAAPGAAAGDAAARRLQNKRLVDAFGSTRRKRQLASREEGAVTAGRLLNASGVLAALEGVNAAAAATGQTREEVMARAAAARNIPPHHPSATRPQDAYVITEVFPPTLLGALAPGPLLKAADSSEAADEARAKGRIPEYVMGRLSLLRDPGAGEGARKRCARALALVAALLSLAPRARSRLRAPPPTTDPSPSPAAGGGGGGGIDALARAVRVGRAAVLEPLLEMFYNHGHEADGGDVWVRDATQREALLAHALLAALAAEGAASGGGGAGGGGGGGGWALAPDQFEALRAQLQLTAAELVAKFRELGCTCTAAKLAHREGATAYHVALLPARARGDAPPKTLSECFPKPKRGAKQQRR